MKYEAKQVGATTTPISQASGVPWVSISQTAAIANSQNVVVNGSACGSSCHLITEAEWLTVAQNVLSVPGNWSGGTVGSGYIPRGNSDGLAATDATADLTGINKRTLTLTNGEVIWDLAGNVWEWTSGVTNGTSAQQPGVVGNNYASWTQWNAVNTPGGLSPSPFPNYGIPAASGWTSANGIGMLLSSTTDTALHGFDRGGAWGYGSNAGVLALGLDIGPSTANSLVSFRASR